MDKKLARQEALDYVATSLLNVALDEINTIIENTESFEELRKSLLEASKKNDSLMRSDLKG
ncbi:hypothetical protein [Vibrio tubiashii]|uniref:hypothetical protein n=1 Tax=Vibrio tubiashii TaxID=29498 RepID=UPI0002E24938|nr:hypothetical protein [Vibrio tubiashii]